MCAYQPNCDAPPEPTPLPPEPPVPTAERPTVAAVPVLAAAAIALGTSVLTGGDSEGSLVSSFGFSFAAGVAEGFGREAVAEALAKSVFFCFGFTVAVGVGLGDRFGATVDAAVWMGLWVAVGVGVASAMSLCIPDVNAVSADSFGSSGSSRPTGGGMSDEFGGAVSSIGAKAAGAMPAPPSIQRIAAGGGFPAIPPHRTTAEITMT